MAKSWLVAIGVVAVAVLGVVGCGPSGPKTHTVRGQVQLSGADIQLLAGHTLEAAQESNPEVRAYGAILSDGSFALETYDKGQIHKGAYEGKYKARIVLSDDHPENNSGVAQALHPTYLHFETSGLTIDVPAKSDLTLPIQRR